MGPVRDMEEEGTVVVTEATAVVMEGTAVVMEDTATVVATEGTGNRRLGVTERVDMDVSTSRCMIYGTRGGFV